MFNLESIISYLYAVPGILFAMSIHEFCHGYVASKLGDPTAKLSGRLTLNPMKHIDIFGLLAMLIVRVGWAKPVPINSRYFKKPRRDIALTAIAGPISNIVSAFIAMIVYYVLFAFILPSFHNISVELLQGILLIFQNFMLINIGFAIFNLIPIPPLDGSRILDCFLPPKAMLAYHKYEQMISIALLLLLVFDLISISPAVEYIYGWMFKAVDFICGGIYNLFV